MTTLTVSDWYYVDSEEITYAAQAPADLAGKTGTVWRVWQTARHPHAHGTARPVASMHGEAVARAIAVARFTADQPVSVPLADGRTVRVPAGHVPHLRGVDIDGNLVVESDGIVAALTPCCHASGKGSIDSLSGVVCRCCYADVGSYFGGPAEVHAPVAG